ncbi:MAG TPA: flippase activity-associated protein Agl23 [Opitutaceae bacterium]|jgi:uncharacterized protein (TIGR03663 family)
MPRALLRWLPVALLALAALWLRTRALSSRPMHADEANQAVKAGQLVESGRYAFDPREHHGPTLYYAARVVAWIRGERTLAEMDEWTVRLVPALAGTLAVVLLYFLGRPLGSWPALGAAAFLAVSPPAVYYSRFFIQETLLAAFSLGAFVCVRRWWLSGGMLWAVATGICLGLMQATKESAPVLALAALAALLVCRPLPNRPPRAGRAVLVGAASALATAALFYSSFGSHPAGLRDALSAYGEIGLRLGSGATGQEKPWWYYLRLFGWERNGGLVFEQVGFAALVVFGAIVAAAAGGPPIARWALAYSVLVILALSIPAYKTPWNAIHLVPGFSLLAASGLAFLAKRGSLGRLAAPAAALFVLALLLVQTRRVTWAYPSDGRNPYAYVHSSPDVLKFRSRVETALRTSPDSVVRVISEEYWPLPWYLRGLDRVGYWVRPPADCDGALVIASADLADAVRARLHGNYSESFLGLRPGFVCILFERRP